MQSPFCHCNDRWDQLAERAIPSAARFADRFVREVDDALVHLDSLHEGGRLIQRDQILVKMAGDEIAEARVPMLVTGPVEQAAERAQESE
jgi:hypothetical protein